MQWIVEWALDWPVGSITSFTLLGIGVLFTWMIGLMIYQHLDIKWGSVHVVSGTVRHKAHDDGWRTYAAAPTMMGTSSLPTKTFPETWNLTVEIRGHVQIFQVSKAFFHRVQIGQSVPVEAIVGHYTKKKRFTRVLSQ